MRLGFLLEEQAVELDSYPEEGEGELETHLEHGELSGEAVVAVEGSSYAVEAAEGLGVPGFGWEVLAVLTPSVPLGRGEAPQIEHSPPLASLAAAGEAEGPGLPPNLPVTVWKALGRHLERIFQHLQLGAEHGIGAEVRIRAATPTQSRPAHRGELSVTAEVAGEHLVDWRSCSLYSAGSPWPQQEARMEAAGGELSLSSGSP